MNTQAQPQELLEQAQESAEPQSPYTTPTLVRLGNVKQVTEGVPYMFFPDSGGFSL
jgi:hypothetical protein